MLVMLLSFKIGNVKNAIFKFLISSVSYYHVTFGFRSESTLYSLPECQGTPCLKQALYLKFK